MSRGTDGAVAPEGDEPVSLDRLAGDWVIHQLVRGHRFSADDLLTAWFAAGIAPGARRLLDLGAGIGSVGLMTLWKLGPEASLVMVEAQEVSHRLARRTVAVNGLEGRVEPRWGDIRDPGTLPEGRVYDLVTGSPPYVPLGKGHVSPHPQRAACRMELRGTIADYALAAARTVRPGGWFVACFAGTDPRAEAGIAAAGLHLRRRRDVRFRAHLAPTITLLAATPEPGDRVDEAPLVIRDHTGEWTDAYLAIRAEMGTVVRRSTTRAEGAAIG